MVYFHEIRIYNNSDGKFTPLEKYIFCITHLIERLIKKKLVTKNARVINVYITQKSNKHLVYSKSGGFVTIDYDVNMISGLKSLKNATEYGKRKIVLDILYEALCHLAVNENWNIDVVIDVYNKCLELEIKNEWWFKDKLFPSAQKQHYAGLHHIWDENGFHIFLVLFDGNKKEIIRHLIFKAVFDSHSIQRFSWKTKDTIHYKFVGEKKEFLYSVEQLLKSKVKKVPARTQLMFK
jgi:hypothetical protein